MLTSSESSFGIIIDGQSNGEVYFNKSILCFRVVMHLWHDVFLLFIKSTDKKIYRIPLMNQNNNF